MAAATGHWIPYTLLAVGVGLGTLWLGYLRNWTLLRWPAALVANVMIVAAAGRAGSAPGRVLLVQVIMLVAYLASFALRTLARDRAVIAFEAVQSAGVLVTALGGAIYLLASAGASPMPVGILTLSLATGGYAVAFTFVERRRHARNVLYYSFLALALDGWRRALRRSDRRLDRLRRDGGHGGNTRAEVTTPAFVRARDDPGSRRRAHVRPSRRRNDDNGVAAGNSAAGTSGARCARCAGAARKPSRSRFGRTVVCRRVILAVLPGVALYLDRHATTVSGLAALAAGSQPVDPALLNTLRTAVLALATVVVARAGREPGGREAGWLTYPLLALTGLKLLVVDFPNGRPSTLFIGLALYGVVLIAGPGLLPREAMHRA